MDNYYKSNEFKRVLAQYENLDEDERALLSTGDYSDIAQYYHNLGNDDKALEAIKTALSVYPGSTGPLSFLSRYALFEEQDSKKARNIAESIDDKMDPDYILLTAEIMLNEGRVDEADAYLHDAYKQFYGDDYYDDMSLDIAILFADYGELEISEEWLQLSDETDENDYIETEARILIGKKEYAKAESLINELINNEPYSPDYWNLLATAQAQDGHVNESITSSDYALAIDPDNSDALLQKGNGMMILENYPEAEKLFRKYLEKEPKRDTGYMMIGLVLTAEDQPQEALTYFSKALAANEKGVKNQWRNRIEIYFQMSTVENYLEHYNIVHDYLEKIADIYREHTSDDVDELGISLAEIDCAHGHVCLEEEKIDEALDWFDQAVTESNGDTGIYCKIAATAYECGYVEYAYNILHELLFNNGEENDLGYKYLVSCCKFLGKNEEEKWAQDKLEKDIKPLKK